MYKTRLTVTTITPRYTPVLSASHQQPKNATANTMTVASAMLILTLHAISLGITMETDSATPTISNLDAFLQHLADGWKTIRTVTIRMLQSGSEPHVMQKRHQNVEDASIMSVHARQEAQQVRLDTTLTMTAMGTVIQTTGRSIVTSVVSSRSIMI